MKLRHVLLPLLAGVFLAGCQVTARVPSPVEIKVNGGGGKHCPPGQAKKGRC